MRHLVFDSAIIRMSYIILLDIRCTNEFFRFSGPTSLPVSRHQYFSMNHYRPNIYSLIITTISVVISIRILALFALLYNSRNLRTSNHRNSWHCRLGEWRRVRILEQATLSGTVFGRSVAPLLPLSLDFLAVGRPAASDKCALHAEKRREIEREYSRAGPAAAVGSLRPKIFSGTRRVEGGRPTGLSVSHRMNVCMCGRRAIANDQKTSIMKNRRVSQWQTGSLFVEADE